MSENIQVPNGWEVKKLGEVFDIQMCKRIYKEQTNYESGIPFYKIGTIGKEADAFIDEQLYNIYKNKYNYPLTGETLITCSGTIGKCYQYNGEEAYFQDSNIVWLRAKNHNKINLNYIFIVVSNIRWNSVEKTTITRLYTPTLKKAKILLPPLEEQKKIAEILMLWDKAIEQTKELITYKEKQKKGLMQLLLTGKKRLDGFTDEWKTVKLGEVAEMSSGGTPTTSKEEYYNGNINWVSITDITSSYKYLYKTKIKITELGLKNSSAKLFPINTVLFAMYASIGECIIAKEEMATSQAILGIRCSDSLNYEYLFYLLYNYKENSKKLAQQGTQANLNKEIVENFIFKIPTSFSEQKAIAEVLSKADEEIELLNKQLELYTEQKKGLMQNLLTGKIRV